MVVGGCPEGRGVGSVCVRSGSAGQGTLGMEGYKSDASVESKGYGSCPFGPCLGNPPPAVIFSPVGAPVMV
jgi:hypothetical protein